MDSEKVSRQCTSKLAYKKCRDRISELPDPILVHILSLLPSARDVMKTSMLAKRWETLWPSVAFLRFSYTDFEDGNKFRRFVDNYLIRRGASVVDTFELRMNKHKGKHSDQNHQIARWIQYAIRSNVRVLYIEVSRQTVNLPVISFNCHSLEELSFINLNLNSCLRAPNLISLCQLRSLSLQGLIIGDNMKITNICPLLEDLCLESCSFNNLEISFQRVTKLRVEICKGTWLRIVCPNLIYFQYNNKDIGEVVLEGLSSLGSASICLPLYVHSNFYRELSNATSLDWKIEMFHLLAEWDFLNFESFYNLKTLKLRRLELCKATIKFSPVLGICTKSGKSCSVHRG